MIVLSDIGLDEAGAFLLMEIETVAAPRVAPAPVPRELREVAAIDTRAAVELGLDLTIEL